MVHHCCAFGCSKSADLYRNLKFHRFPLNNYSLLHKWIRAVRRKDFTPTKATRICGDHFVEDDYGGRNLKPTAVPSIFNFEATSQRKTTKVLAEEQDITFPNELSVALPKLCVLPEFDTPEHQLAASESTIIEWDPLKELGLDSNQVELQFEDDTKLCLDEQPKFLRISATTLSYFEKGTQTLINKCNTCENHRDKFRLLRKQINRRDDKIRKLQNIVTGLKQQIRDSKKRKIKIVGNSVILIDKYDNNKSAGDIVSINEQYQVSLSVS